MIDVAHPTSSERPDLDDLNAVTFTVRPHFFKVGGTTDGRLPDGMPFVEIQRALTKGAIAVEPG